MNCGIPYCHGTGSVAPGTPRLPGQQPDPRLQRSRLHGNWEEASRNLHSTNNFPEFTGRICPAPCEASCTLNIDDNPVTIKTIECAIVDRAWGKGWSSRSRRRTRPARRSPWWAPARRGSPAPSSSRAPATTSMSTRNSPRPAACCATAFPTSRWRSIIDRRVAQMEAEGVTFHYGADVGADGRSTSCSRSTTPLRSPAAPKRRATCRCPAAISTASISRWISCRSRTAASATSRRRSEPILASGKHVVVIGGGDTGSDCIGTSIRQGALSVTQLEIMPQPPEHENKPLTWPNWPLKMRTSSSHQEGAARDFAVLTQEILRRRRQGHEAAMRPGRRQDQAGPRQRIRARGRSGAAGDGLRASGA